MKRVLILSYHYPPMNAIASNRTFAYAEHFFKDGVYPTIVTHFWDDQVRDSVQVEEYKTHRVIRLPFMQRPISKLHVFMEGNKYLNKIAILLAWTRGHLDTISKLGDSYYTMKSFLFEHLKSESYDFSLGVFSPHYHLKLCFKINKKFGLPYIIDFRDLWANRVVMKAYNPTAIEKLQDIFTKHFWTRWLSKASFFTITSQPWLKYLNRFTDTQGHVITNGFEEKLYENKAFVNNEKFTIVHTGSVYSHQKLRMFFDGFRKFRDMTGAKDFKVNFIGSERKLKRDQSGLNSFSNIQPFIDEFNVGKFITATGRIPHKEIAFIQQNADLLLFPSFPDSRGTYSGKIFEYLGARRPILSFPMDNSVVDELLLSTNAGVIANSSEEICDILMLKYGQWSNSVKLDFAMDGILVDKYSRCSQVKKMTSLIHGSHQRGGR